MTHGPRANRSLGAKTPLYAPDSACRAPRPRRVAGRPSGWLTSPEMAGFGDAPLVGPGSELQLTIDGQVVPHAEVLADRDLELLARAPAREKEPAGVGEGLEQRNLFAVAEQLAARAATPSTRRQYAAIYRSFGDWLRGELGPPARGRRSRWRRDRRLRPAPGDGGRSRGAARRRRPRGGSISRWLRALARELGRDDVAAGVKVPRHTAGPPETMTEADYQNLLRVPDRRCQLGKRDHALLRVLGDCGLRSAELRGLIGRDLRRPRANARPAWGLARDVRRRVGASCVRSSAPRTRGLAQRSLGRGQPACGRDGDHAADCAGCRRGPLVHGRAR